MINIVKRTASAAAVVEYSPKSGYKETLIQESYDACIYNNLSLQLYKQAIRKELSKVLKSRGVSDDNWYFDISVEFNKVTNVDVTKFKNRDTSGKSISAEYHQLMSLFADFMNTGDKITSGRERFENRLVCDLYMITRGIFKSLPNGPFIHPMYSIKSSAREYYFMPAKFTEKRWNTKVDRAFKCRKDLVVNVIIKLFVRDYSSREYINSDKVATFDYCYLGNLDNLK